MICSLDFAVAVIMIIIPAIVAVAALAVAVAVAAVVVVVGRHISPLLSSSGSTCFAHHHDGTHRHDGNFALRTLRAVRQAQNHV